MYKFFFFFFNFILVEPQITNNHLTRKAAANVGSDVKLYCRARGSPLPKFIWTFNDKTLSPNITTDKYKITRKEVNKNNNKNNNILNILYKKYFIFLSYQNLRLNQHYQ